jgi:Mn-dependent DtxR family transcriptional regulator
MQERIVNGSTKKRSSEDYMLAVYTICRLEGSARQVDIAVHMNANTPCVIRGLNRLAQRGLVTIIKEEVNRKECRLTETGRVLGKKLDRRRSVITTFLESLGLSENDAAKEAHLWEHGISDETTDAMEAALLRAKAPGASKPPAAAPSHISRIMRQRSYHRSESQRSVRKR